MKVAIHQPNFLPWIGFFNKIAKVDKFVLLDDVQYTRNSYINRNKIKTPNGEQWLTMPVLMAGKFGQNINNVIINNKNKAISKILKTIKMNYSKSTYFDIYYPQILEILEKDDENLSNINIELIKMIKKELEIATELFSSSQLDNIEGTSTERLISICKELDCNVYLSGFGGVNYQEKDIFEREGIKLIITDFVHPTYPQLWGDFIPNLSIIDLLFNCGPESKKYINY